MTRLGPRVHSLPEVHKKHCLLRIVLTGNEKVPGQVMMLLGDNAVVEKHPR